MMKTWIKLSKSEPVRSAEFDYGKHQALMALLLPYRLPTALVQLTEKKQVEYFARIGHGHKASPEIISGSRDYLISAGGVQRAKRSQIVARNTVLLLNDGALDYKDCFHLKSAGKMDRWNNTGVYHRFACAKGTAHAPVRYLEIVKKNDWHLYQPYKNKNFYIVIYDNEEMAFIMVIPNPTKDPAGLLANLIENNRDEQLLQSQVYFPDGTLLQYDLNAPRSKWVIKANKGVRVERDFDSWSRMKIESVGLIQTGR